MAEAVVGKVLEQLVSIISDDIQRRWMLVTGVEKQVKKLAATLRAIQAALADAEQRQLTDKSVELWVRSLKNVSYDMDDLLDEWLTTSATAALQRNNDQPTCLKMQLIQISNFLRKVCSFFPSSCFSCCSQSIGSRYNIGTRVEELNGVLDDITNRMQGFRFNVTIKSSSSSKQSGHTDHFHHVGALTSSVLNVEVKGREKEKDLLVKWLVSDGNSSSSSSGDPANLFVVSVVGMGGLGKTTLAKSTYKQVGNHFDKCIWVCVSEPFDQRRIATEILEGFLGSKPDLEGLSAILERISELGRERKFLLVLDDAWEEDGSKWEELMGSLRSGQVLGSRVVVTTRKEGVANALGCTKARILQLPELSYEHCWSIFQQHAFLGWDVNGREYDMVKNIGEEIVRHKCNGLPLAAKALGGLLCSKRSRRQWDAVLRSKIWELKERKDIDLFAPLWLSYYDLSLELRQCFAYCAVFPKDHDIEKEELIRLWMAQGYLGWSRSGRSSGEVDLGLVGEKYFEELSRRCLFQDFDDDNGKVGTTECKMHDLVHDFVQFVSNHECGNLEVEEDGGLIRREGVRHLTVTKAPPEFVSSNINGGSLKGLRSLVVVGNGMVSYDEMVADVTRELTCLRSLKLRDCRLSALPQSISKLIHLRLFLLLGTNLLHELPDELSELHNLQTLSVEGCTGITKWPRQMEKLVNLRYLLISESFAKPIAKGVGRLDGLRVLPIFVLEPDDKTAATLSDLGNLNMLQGQLRIEELGASWDHVEEATQAQLERKMDITALTLKFAVRSWRWGDERRRIEVHEGIIEAMKPSECVEDLSILSYYGETFRPSWMPLLINLTRLKLRWADKCTSLPCLATLPSLDRLELEIFYSLKKLGSEFLGVTGSSSSSSFPKLTYLGFDSIDSLEEWEEWDEDQFNIMPCIQTLHINCCNNLKRLPDQLVKKTTLQTLKIESSDCLIDLYKEEQGKDWDMIKHIPCLQVDKYNKSKLAYYYDMRGGYSDSE